MLGSSLLPVARCLMACQRSADCCGSRSITSTLRLRAAAIARCRASVVFPLPPFWLTMLHTFIAAPDTDACASTLLLAHLERSRKHHERARDRGRAPGRQIRKAACARGGLPLTDCNFHGRRQRKGKAHAQALGGHIGKIAGSFSKRLKSLRLLALLGWHRRCSPGAAGIGARGKKG